MLKRHKGDQEQMGSVCMRSHVAAGTLRCFRLPVSFGMLLTGEVGAVLWLCFVFSYFLFGTIERDVRRRCHGGELVELPDAGRRRVLRKR